ncbi:MAG: hypothetical protein QM756_24250 [Polyangiaceae bacterium]
MLTKTLVVDGITPVLAYQVLRQDAGLGSFLLESVVPGERWGRYSIWDIGPKASSFCGPRSASIRFSA